MFIHRGNHYQQLYGSCPGSSEPNFTLTRPDNSGVNTFP